MSRQGDKHVVRPPRYAQTFAKALRSVPAAKLTLPGFDPPLVGHPGFRKRKQIHYSDKNFQKLRHAHEYMFAIRGRDVVEVSLQLYETARDYWRLFAYCPAGMLFSVNLSLAQQRSATLFPLSQRLKIAARHMTAKERAQAASDLAEHLRTRALRVSPERDVDLGDFDTKKRAFERTTARRFLQEFLTVAVIKGHFMGNKGYSLPSLPSVPQRGPETMADFLDREQSLAENKGVFDPADEHDARTRVLASIVRRRGQQRFRAALLEAYQRRCAFSGCDAVEALEAAHIQPYGGPQTNEVCNGLLLRADLHTLFDLGHITVNANMKLRISAALRGTTYESLDGRPLSPPEDDRLHPCKRALALHRSGAKASNDPRAG